MISAFHCLFKALVILVIGTGRPEVSFCVTELYSSGEKEIILQTELQQYCYQTSAMKDVEGPVL